MTIVAFAPPFERASVVATAFTLLVPATGFSGTPATVTVTPNGVLASTVNVLLAVAGGGTLALSGFVFPAGSSAAQSTTITRSSDGTSTLTMTNDGGLGNNGTPAGYTASSMTWAPGSVIGGSFNAATNVWTPERDGSGVVKALSWDEVPTGRWVQIAGSELSQLEAAVRAAYTDWPSPNPLWFDGVQRSWSHPAIDTAGSRMFFAASGGHSDGANNGVYEFSAFKMAWASRLRQENPTSWTTTYRNSGNFTSDPESAALAAAQTSGGSRVNINGVGYDELYYSGTPATGTTNNKKPTSRHLYFGLVYKPDTDDLLLMCRRMWRYSLASNAWTYKRWFDDTVDNPSNILGEECIAYYDEAAQEVLAGGGGSGSTASVRYSFSSNAWQTAVSVNRDVFGGAACRHDNMLFSMRFPDGDGTQKGGYRRWNITSRTTDATSYDLSLGELGFVLGSGTAYSDFKASYGYDYGGAAYIPSLNRYWAWALSPTRTQFLVEIDPTTSPRWTMTKMTSVAGHAGANNIASSDGQSISPVYLPALNALFLISGGAATPMYVYRF